MLLKRDAIRKIIQKNKCKRLKELSDDLDDILFLDFDGVINTDINNFGEENFNENCIKYLNKLCMERNLKIVISSSWKKYNNCEEILYNSGLNNNIKIVGKTVISNGDRIYEILDYIKNHKYINKVLILDDRLLKGLEKYHVRTIFEIGLDEEKYIECLNVLDNQ